MRGRKRSKLRKIERKKTKAGQMCGKIEQKWTNNRKRLKKKMQKNVEKIRENGQKLCYIEKKTIKLSRKN